MSKIKSMALAQYDSIYEAVCGFRDKNQLPYDQYSNVAKYSPKALEDVLFFLAFNDIHRSYNVTPFENGALVSVSWTDENGNMGCVNWYECNEDNSYYLVKYCDNWADEFDVEGFMVLNSAQMREWEAQTEDFRKCFRNGRRFDFWFGTNEWIEYSSFEDFVAAFDIQKITKDEAEFLFKHMSKIGVYGIIPTVDTLEDWIEDAQYTEE